MKKFGRKVLSLALAAVITATSVQLDAFATVSTDEMVQTESASEEEVSAQIQQNETAETDSEQYAKWKQSYLESQCDDGLALDGSSSGNYIRNDIIEAFVDSQGLFTIGTVNGSDLATDNHRKLLFGHPNPWSSFTTVKIDGADHKFLGTENRSVTRDAIMTSSRIDNVVTTQSLSIVENEYTGKPDTIAITYTMTNNDDTAHDVGLRIMMDTMLGNNDGAPFRVPGYGNVTKELELTGGDIPQNWMAFDSLDDPDVIANGCFYRTLDEKPDKVQFASWREIEGTLWNYTTSLSTTVTYDSAVAAYYNPQTLSPGESRAVTTYYGIGDFAVSDAKPPLSTRVVAPAELVADTQEGGYTHNPFSVTAYVQNNGNATANNVKVQLKLPSDGSLQLISPVNATQSLGNIAQGDEAAATWIVYAKEQSAKKTAKYAIVVSADNEQAKTVNVSTVLPKTKELNENFTVKLNQTKVTLDVNGTTQLKATCSDGKERSVTWFSTNTAVAKVDNKGQVKAVGSGKANIVACINSKNAICEVIVTGTATTLQSISLNNSSLQMQVGQTKQLTVSYTPATISQKGVKWTSSNPAVAKVSENGRVDAGANGTATIKAVANADGSKSAECTVEVNDSPQSVSFDQSVSFSDTLKGPEVSLLGKDFNLFQIPMTTELKFNEEISLSYDSEEKSLTGTFGLTGGGSLTDKDEYKNDYTKIKKAAEKLKKDGPKKFINTYGKVLKNKKTQPVFFQKGEVSTFGYVKFQQVNGTYQFAEGEVYAVMSWPEIFEIKYNLPACPIVYFRFNISGDLQGGFKLEMVEMGTDSQKMQFDGTVAGSLSIEGGVGADVLVAGLEGGLKGTLSIELKNILHFNKNDSLEIKLAAAAYIKAKALFFLEFSDEWKFASVQLYPWVANNAANALSLDSANFVPMATNVAPLNLTSDNASQLQNNGYAYNEPQMVRLSDGRIFAAWADNVSGRSTYDRTGIYYSICENGNWSDPVLVDDDGTADFSPAVAADGDKVYIAWQNMDKSFGTSARLADMLPHTGIKMACYDGSAITGIKKLTADNDKYDSIPRIAAADGNVTVVWCNNANDDWALFEGTNTVKQYSTSSDAVETVAEKETASETETESETKSETEESKVEESKTEESKTEESKTEESEIEETETAPVKTLKTDKSKSVAEDNASSAVTTLYSAEKIITSYDVAYHNGKAIVALSAENSTDLNNFNPINKVYENGSENTSLASAIRGRQVTLVQNGTVADAYWWDGTSIKSIRALDTSKVENCYASQAAVNFKATSNGENAVVYWAETDGNTSSLKAVIRDSANGSWYLPADVYTFDGVIRDSSLLVVSDGRMQILTNAVKLNEDKSDAEVALVYLNIAPNVDLQIVEEPYFNENDVVFGRQLDINVDVKNNGTATAQSVLLTILDETGNQITSKTVSESIAPGFTKTLTIPYELPESMAYHKIIVKAEPVGALDSNLQDNEASVDIGEADIRVSDLKVSGYGAERKVFVEVSNNGYQTAENITVNVTSKTTNGTVIGSAVIDAIEGRTKKSVSFTVKLSDLDFGADSGVLIYAQLLDGDVNLGTEVMMSSVILNPVEEDTITIGTGAYDNKKLILNLYNNKNSQVTADLYVELLDNGNTVFRVGQTLSLDAYATQTSQLDLKSLLIYPHDRICVYVMDDNGMILSNRVYHNSQSATVGEFDIKPDKEHLILKKGDTANLSASLNIQDFGLADLTWKSTDETIVTVDNAGNVKAVAEGVANIIIGSSILGINAECKIVVVDETPIDDYVDAVLRTKNVTVDLAKDTGAVVSFTSIYRQNSSGVAVEGAASEGEEAFTSAVTEKLIIEDETVRELFDIKLIDDGTALLVPTAKAANSPECINKTYVSEISLQLKGSSEKKEVGELTIKTISTLPEVKAKAGKLDCYYSDAAAAVTFKSKGKAFNDIVTVSVDPTVDSKNNTNPEYFAYDNDANALVIAEQYKSTVKKGTYPVRLLVNIKGYTVPASTVVKLSVTETVPSVKLTASEIRLRAVVSENYAYIGLKLPKGFENRTITAASIIDDNSNVYDVSFNDSNVLIKNKITISGTQNYKIGVRLAGTTRDVTIPVKIKAITDETGYRISAGNVQINRVGISDNFAQVKISGAADNDMITTLVCREVVKNKETSLTNVYTSFNSTTGTLTITPRYKDGTFKLRIYPEGSSKPLNLSVKVYAKYPTYKASKSSIQLNTQTRETQTVYITNNMDASNGFSYSIVNSKNRFVSVASVSYGDGYISLTPYSYAVKGSYKLIITPYNSGGKQIKVTLKVSDKAPGFSISGGVKLNKALPYTSEQAVVTMKASPSAYVSESFTFYQVTGSGKKTSLNELTDFVITKGADGKLYIRRSSDNVATGTYKIRAISNNFGKAKPVNFKIVVEDKKITFTQKGSILLNSNITGQAEKSKINLTTTSNIDDIGEFTFFEKTGKTLSECQNVTITKESDGYYVSLKDTAKVKNGTINLVARSQTYKNANDANIKITVTNKEPSMKASFTGKIDSVNLSSYAEVKLTMSNASVVLSDEGKLSIDNVNFSLYQFRPEDATVRIRLTSTADLGPSKAKKAVITYEDADGNKISTDTLTIPVTTSKVKLEPDKSLYEIYRADKTDEALVKLVLSGNVNATVDSVEFAKAEDAAKFEIRCVSKATRKYAIGILDESAVSAGKYSVKLKIKVHGITKPIQKTITIDVK